MQYQIISTLADGEFVKTTVRYTFTDGNEVTIEVPHFMPRTREEVLIGIENRGISEQMKRDAATLNQQIAASLI